MNVIAALNLRLGGLPLPLPALLPPSSSPAADPAASNSASRALRAISQRRQRTMTSPLPPLPSAKLLEYGPLPLLLPLPADRGQQEEQ